ncbi:MAG: hypothetical protein M1833_000040 [Piccolia ochrophora]|nr:MAG: hypothetical protein M1833_000040 [Piccolia ochrophora]
MATAMVATAQAVPTKKTHDSSDYKEVLFGGPKTFDEEAETKGTDKQPPARYPNYLPVWDKETFYPPLTPFKHYEHGKDADDSLKNLLGPDAVVDDHTATIGADVTGVQLSQLNDAGKDELARFVAHKKVVGKSLFNPRFTPHHPRSFRNQDFADLPIEQAVEFVRYFGRLHIHPTSGAPKGFPEVHLVHRGAHDTTAKDFFETRTNSVTWHSDVTYEQQPPGTTFLYLLDGPASGGDTLFLNQVEAYNRLSPEFQKRLLGLKAVHSGKEQARNSANRDSTVRREPVDSVHPVIRTHPVTGERALYVNPQFTRSIVGFKKEESDYLLKFLYDHMAFSQDLQTRVRWSHGTVVVWDNRVTAHSAILDWHNGARRHLARLTPQAERPVER